jgi:hypothetical protein
MPTASYQRPARASAVAFGFDSTVSAKHAVAACRSGPSTFSASAAFTFGAAGCR